MKRSSVLFGVTVCLLGGTLTGAKLSTRRGTVPLAQPLATIDGKIGGWTGVEDPPAPDSIVKSLAATSELSRTYRIDQRHLNLFIAFYANQNAGESMHSPKYCLPGGGWEPLDIGVEKIPVGGRLVDVNRYQLYKSGERMLLLYWYQNRRRVIASEYLNKAYLAWDAFRYAERSGSIVRISLPDGPSALKDAVAFASAVMPQVSRCFGSPGV